MTTIALGLTGWDIPTLPDTAPATSTTRETLALLDWSLRNWVTLPSFGYRSAPEAQIQAIQLADWTGLSLRALADLLGTTHPTMSALVSGRSTDLARKPRVMQNLQTLHAVVERLVPIAPDARTLADCLIQPGNSFDGTSIAELALNESPATAYMAALKVLRPRPLQSLKSSFAPREEGTATVALED